MTGSAAHSISPYRFWGTIVGVFVVAMLIMIGCAYAWVVVYSVAINSSGDAAFYEAYARVASPIVAVVVSFPVFYCVGRYMRRFGQRALFGALSVVWINLAVDVLALGTVAEGLVFNVTMSAFAALGKILGAYSGARHAIAQSAQAAHPDAS